MYLSPDKMIAVLTSGISFLSWLCDYALLMRWFDHRLSIKEENGFVWTEVVYVWHCCFCWMLQCDHFSPIDVMFRISILLTKWTGFCFCCFCVSFFLNGPKLLEVMVVLLPGENSKCQFLRQYCWLSTRDELSRWHSFGLFLSEAKEPISWDFLCRAQLSLWTDNVLAKVGFVLRCLIDAVWTPH